MQVQERGQAIVIQIVADECTALWKLVEPCIERGKRSIVLDFNQVEFINSVNIAQVIAVRQRATAAGAQVRVANLRENVRAIFRILKLDRLFDLNQTLDAALH